MHDAHAGLTTPPLTSRRGVGATGRSAPLLSDVVTPSFVVRRAHPPTILNRFASNGGSDNVRQPHSKLDLKSWEDARGVQPLLGPGKRVFRFWRGADVFSPVALASAIIVCVKICRIR